MNIAGIQTQLATTLGAVTGVAEAHAQMPDSIGAPPAIVVGQPQLTVHTGGRQDTDVQMPVFLLVSDAPNEAIANAAISSFVNLVIAALAPISSASGLWNVITQIDVDTNRLLKVGTGVYRAIRFVIHMEIVEAVNTYGSI